MTFGERLREIRKSRGISQRALAEMVQIDFTYISKIEAGSMEPPSAIVIRHMAQTLETDESELLSLSGKVPADLGRALKENPLLTELVCLLSRERLPDEVYRAMIAIGREST